MEAFISKPHVKLKERMSGRAVKSRQQGWVGGGGGGAGGRPSVAVIFSIILHTRSCVYSVCAFVCVCVVGGVHPRLRLVQKAKATRAAIIQTRDKTTGPTFPAGISDIPSMLRDNYPCEGGTRSASPPDLFNPGAGKSSFVRLYSYFLLFFSRFWL